MPRIVPEIEIDRNMTDTVQEVAIGLVNTEKDQGIENVKHCTLSANFF